VEKAEDVIGYRPSTPFETGLRNTIQWFEQNWDRIEASARFAPGASSAVREMAAVEK
jgi:dTDP-D-glucose 4,6-dehydratase